MALWASVCKATCLNAFEILSTKHDARLAEEISLKKTANVREKLALRLGCKLLPIGDKAGDK
jgi:hypothetical protein